MYSGPFVDVAESIFKHNNELYVQRIILPRHSSTFTLKFKSYAELGLEIFLNFETKTHSQSDNWFYTFNSADIMSRHPFLDKPYLIGDNYFPITGGLLIESGNTFLHMYPDYPLGAGMPDHSSFQLHMHRNPYADDNLGIGVYYGEYSPAEHSLLFGFTELNPGKIWDEYLRNKASPLVFFKSYGETVTEFIEEAEIVGNWGFNTEYSLMNEDKCVYLSDVNVKGQAMLARVLNICEETMDFELNGLEIVEEVNALGGKLEKRQRAKESGELEFNMNLNSGKDFVEYPQSLKEGLVKPFHFNTYKVQRV